MLCELLLYSKVTQLYTHTHTHIYIKHIYIYIYIYILFHILFHYGLSEDNEYSSYAIQ